jgi:molecular chaperone DnaK (HSP70)
LGEKQRRIILDAAKIVEVHVLKLFNAITVDAIAYSIYHLNKFPNKAEEYKSILISDISDSLMNVVIVSIYQGSLKIKKFYTDEALDGLHFITELQSLLLERVKQKRKHDLTSNHSDIILLEKQLKI